MATPVIEAVVGSPRRWICSGVHPAGQCGRIETGLAGHDVSQLTAIDLAEAPNAAVAVMTGSSRPCAGVLHRSRAAALSGPRGSQDHEVAEWLSQATPGALAAGGGATHRESARSRQPTHNSERMQHCDAHRRTAVSGPLHNRRKALCVRVKMHPPQPTKSTASHTPQAVLQG